MGTSYIYKRDASRLLIALRDNGKRYKIAGDWTHKAGKHTDGVWWVSRSTPVATAVIGRKAGDAVTFGAVAATITEIA